MPTVFTHAAVGFAASRISGIGTSRRSRVAFACAGLAALPDVDTLLRRWIPYSHPLAHRGLTHSLSFAVAVGLLAALVFHYRKTVGESQTETPPEAATETSGNIAGETADKRILLKLWLLFSATIASHGFFDAMTNGGSGVAFLAPFDSTRYFFPWRPIPVAPLSLGGLFTQRGAHLLSWELAFFWTFAASAALWRKGTVSKALAICFCLIGVAAWYVALT